MDDACIFCAIVAGGIPAHVIAEDARTIAFLDINPATRGHALVIPRAHAADLTEIDEADLTACALAAQAVARKALDRLGAVGVNLINSCRAGAWQTVFHFHVHVIPRYAGDGMVLPWTPVPADAGSLRDAAEILRGP